MESQSTTRPASTRRLRSSAPATAPRPDLTEPTGPSLARDGDSTDDSLAVSSQHQQDIDSAILRLMHADGNVDREGASNPSVMEPPAESVRRKPARASRRKQAHPARDVPPHQPARPVSRSTTDESEDEGGLQPNARRSRSRSRPRLVLGPDRRKAKSRRSRSAPPSPPTGPSMAQPAIGQPTAPGPPAPALNAPGLITSSPAASASASATSSQAPVEPLKICGHCKLLPVWPGFGFCSRSCGVQAVSDLGIQQLGRDPIPPASASALPTQAGGARAAPRIVEGVQVAPPANRFSSKAAALSAAGASDNFGPVPDPATAPIKTVY